MYARSKIIKKTVDVRYLFSKHFSIDKSKNCNNSFLKISEEVRNAIECKKPVVALESTIVTHGMPYPSNVECALAVEKVIREQGAVPATIAILKGEIKVGISSEDLNFLGDTNSSNPIKTSRRDFAFVLSNQRNGGTTVAGTLVVANSVGLPIFATGGIGGVHRQAEHTFDVSADLTELGKSDVAVISSGVKSILDIPKTLEYLETQGVLVATFGETNDFPAFYSRSSGCKSPYRVGTASEAAEVIEASRKMGLHPGMLFAVPIPEEYAIDADVMNEVIEKSIKNMPKNLEGKNITPYLLAEVAKLTEGRSLKSNIELIKNNAKTAAEIAVALSKLDEAPKEDPSRSDHRNRPVGV